MTKLQRLLRERHDIIESIKAAQAANMEATDTDLWLAWLKTYGQYPLDRQAFFFIINNI